MVNKLQKKWKLYNMNMIINECVLNRLEFVPSLLPLIITKSQNLLKNK